VNAFPVVGRVYDGFEFELEYESITLILLDNFGVVVRDALIGTV
jgi:hypothetical protein